MWHDETEATDISPDLITLGVIGGTFNPAALKSVILFLFYSTHVAPLKTVHGQVFVEWFGLTDSWICRRAKCGDQVIKDAMVQLKIGPPSRKAATEMLVLF